MIIYLILVDLLKISSLIFSIKDNDMERLTQQEEEVMEIIVNVVGQMDYRIVEDKCYLTRI